MTQIQQICQLHFRDSPSPPHLKAALVDWDQVSVFSIDMQKA